METFLCLHCGNRSMFVLHFATLENNVPCRLNVNDDLNKKRPAFAHLR